MENEETLKIINNVVETLEVLTGEPLDRVAGSLDRLIAQTKKLGADFAELRHDRLIRDGKTIAELKNLGVPADMIDKLVFENDSQIISEMINKLMPLFMQYYQQGYRSTCYQPHQASVKLIEVNVVAGDTTASTVVFPDPGDTVENLLVHICARTKIPVGLIGEYRLFTKAGDPLAMLCPVDEIMDDELPLTMKQVPQEEAKPDPHDVMKDIDPTKY